MTTKQPSIFNPQVTVNPYPIFEAMQKERPIYCETLPTGDNMWFITRYDDVKMVLKDPRFIKNEVTIFGAEEAARINPRAASNIFGRGMLSQDPPDHTRLRNLVGKVFTSRMINSLEGYIEDVANSLLDAVETQGYMDLMRDYAYPIPIKVIAKLLSIPENDHEKFSVWTKAILDAAFIQTAEEVSPHSLAFGKYLEELFALRRKTPGDDLLSQLIQVESEGNKLSKKELFGMVFLLIIAGFETTANLIGNGTLALLQNAEQMALLKNNPDLMEQAVEEMLRFEAPVKTSTLRWTKEDVEINGQTIPKGERVLVVLGAANRDGEQFKQPHTFDISREENNHLAFGFGVHFCLGAPLARLEGRVAFNVLLKRLPNLRLNLNDQALDWRSGILIRGLQTLPVAW